MRRHAPFEPIDPNICVWGGVPGVISRANFFENRPKGFRASRPRNLAFPIDFAGRPYNTHTTVWGVIILSLVAFLVTPKYVTLNDLCWLFRVKFCFCTGSAGWHCATSKNIAWKLMNIDTYFQWCKSSAGTIFWQYKVCADESQR